MSTCEAAHAVNEGTSSQLKMQLTDETGRPITKATIDAVALTLWDIATEDIINSRDAQDIKDANGGTLQGELTISAITQAYPAVMTFTASHNLRDGDAVYIENITGMTELNGRQFDVYPISDTKVALKNEDSTTHTAWSAGGTARTSLLMVDLTASDNALVTTSISRREFEEHQALIAVTYSTTKTLNVDVRIDVRQLRKVT